MKVQIVISNTQSISLEMMASTQIFQIAQEVKRIGISIRALVICGKIFDSSSRAQLKDITKNNFITATCVSRISVHKVNEKDHYSERLKRVLQEIEASRRDMQRESIQSQFRDAQVFEG